ncbi:MAG TPA: CPBP family intramembrane glutamic endopeptidase [Labilithrix sp.]
MIHVRTDGATTRACEPGELVAEGGAVKITAETPIALGADGPFESAAIAIERDGALRDAIADAIPTPSTTAWRRLRWPVLAAAAIPLLMLLELDRELASRGRIAVDAAIALYVAWELTRRTPRLPGVAAACSAAAAVRFALYASKLCGKNVSVLVWAGMLLSGAAAATIAARAPSRARVCLELLAKLGISRSEAFAARLPPIASGRAVAAAVASAIALPVVVALVRRNGVGLEGQCVVLVSYAVLVPIAVRRVTAEAAPVSTALDPRRTLLAIGAGFALAAAFATGAHAFFDTGAELARCTGHLDAEAKRALAAEADEIARSLAAARGSSTMLALTLAVVPLVEERIYRDVLMNTLVRKYGAAYGLFASAIVFGVAHAGVYHVALYQPVLLGLAFGVAYAEGGLLAAFTVHAAWNLALLA